MNLLSAVLGVTAGASSVRPCWLLLLFALINLAGCQALDDFDAWLASEGTNATALPTIKNPPVQCPATAETVFTATKPIVAISYVEPRPHATEGPQLDRTTIYVDPDASATGRDTEHTEAQRLKDVPASNGQGGGTVTETVELPRELIGKSVRLCVTATDTAGRESPPTK